jgi:hypothetical protein
MRTITALAGCILMAILTALLSQGHSAEKLSGVSQADLGQTRAAAQVARYTISGTISLERIDEGRRLTGEFRPLETLAIHSFAIQSDGCNWSLKVVPVMLPAATADEMGLPPGGQPGSTNWHLVAASNGSEFCVYRNGPRSKPGSAYVATRGPGGAPFGVAREVAALWCTYASHCFFQAEGVQKSVPLTQTPLASFAATGNRIPAKVELLNHAPHLPSNVTITGYYYDHQRDVVRPLPEGVSRTNTILRVLSTTNVNGLLLPVEALMHVYDVARNRGEIQAQPVYQVRIQGKSFSSATSLEAYPPALDGVFVVHDARLMAHSDHRVFPVLATNRWPSEPVSRPATDRLPSDL